MRSFLCLLVLLAPALARAQVTYTGHADVTFQGDSNLHAFSGSVSKVPLTVTVRPDGEDRRMSMETTVRVRDLTTDHTKRDREMWKMFDALNFPLLTV